MALKHKTTAWETAPNRRSSRAWTITPLWIPLPLVIGLYKPLKLGFRQLFEFF